MLKILQARLQQYVNHEIPDVQAGFRKGRGTRDQIANMHWIIEKARSFRKTSTSALLTTSKPSTMWITTNCGKFFKRWEYQTIWPAFWEICMQVKKQQVELDMEQQTGSKLGKEYFKAIYFHPAYLAYMQSESESEVAQSCPTLCDPMDTRLLLPWDFPGKKTAMGCHFLLQGIFLTQGLNPGLPHCRQTLNRLSHQGSPFLT